MSEITVTLKADGIMGDGILADVLFGNIPASKDELDFLNNDPHFIKIVLEKL